MWTEGRYLACIRCSSSNFWCLIRALSVAQITCIILIDYCESCRHIGDDRGSFFHSRHRYLDELPVHSALLGNGLPEVWMLLAAHYCCSRKVKTNFLRCACICSLILPTVQKNLDSLFFPCGLCNRQTLKLIQGVLIDAQTLCTFPKCTEMLKSMKWSNTRLTR